MASPILFGDFKDALNPQLPRLYEDIINYVDAKRYRNLSCFLKTKKKKTKDEDKERSCVCG